MVEGVAGSELLQARLQLWQRDGAQQRQRVLLLGAPLRGDELSQHAVVQLLGLLDASATQARKDRSTRSMSDSPTSPRTARARREFWRRKQHTQGVASLTQLLALWSGRGEARCQGRGRLGCSAARTAVAGAHLPA